MSYHVNVSVEVPTTQVLRDVECHGRSEGQDLANLTEQLTTLALMLHRAPQDNGLGKIALGGIQYLIERLMGHYTGGKSLEELRDVYVGVELGRYPSRDDDTAVERMKQFGRANGLVFRAIPVTCADGVERVIFASHLNQTSYDGEIVLREGELVFDPSYYPPPFRKILDELPPT